MESRWAPKRIEKFFGIASALVPDVSLSGVRAKGVNHLAYVSENNPGEVVEAVFLSCVRANM